MLSIVKHNSEEWQSRMMQLEMRVSKMAAMIGASTFTAGVSLIFVGLFFGLGFNQIAVLIFYRSIPFTKIFYIAALVGKRVSFRTDYKMRFGEFF